LQAAKEASQQPLSIVVVGIGSGVPHHWQEARKLEAQNKNVHFVEAQKVNWNNASKVRENLLAKYPQQKAQWQKRA